MIACLLTDLGVARYNWRAWEPVGGEVTAWGHPAAAVAWLTGNTGTAEQDSAGTYRGGELLSDDTLVMFVLTA